MTTSVNSLRPTCLYYLLQLPLNVSPGDALGNLPFPKLLYMNMNIGKFPLSQKLS